MNLLLGEARDRLRQGIADDVQDVCEQLINEGLATGEEATALARLLLARGWR